MLGELKKRKPEWDSLILLNSQKGNFFLSEFQKEMELIESDIEWAVNNNSQLGKPTEMHKNRDLFFELLPTMGFQKAVEKTTEILVWRKCVRKIKRIIKKAMGRN